MGVDYTAILAVGKEFDSRSEAEEFLRDNGKLKGIDEDSIDYDGLEESLPAGMEGGTLNCYSGYGYYIGYGISCSNPSSFQKDFDEGMSCWDKEFQNDEAEIVHTVVVS